MSLIKKIINMLNTKQYVYLQNMFIILFYSTAGLSCVHYDINIASDDC